MNGIRVDDVGNLTFVDYPNSPDVTFQYDWLNRLTNMVDGAGTTKYAYTAGNQLWTEDGPFASDTVTNMYSNRKRVALRLQQPTGLWTNGFGWDLAGRLSNVTSPAGSFGYTYTTADANFSGALVQKLSLPGGAYITNFYDPVARVLGTVLKSSAGTTLDAARYGYNAGNQRTAYTNATGTNVLYAYDPIGQLTVANSSTNSEDRGYAYDSAWNLSWRTNNGAASWWYCNVRNELTNSLTSGPFCYDQNGNLTDGGRFSYEYDDENRLTAVQCLDKSPGYRLSQPDGVGPSEWRTEFLYDGLGRLRWRVEYIMLEEGGTAAPPPGERRGGGPEWYPDYGVQYIYDGWRVIQERGGPEALVSYTRGNDLSGSLEGAGGIGGLLARSVSEDGNSWTGHAYYHADGNGNITCLIDTNQSVVASYRYDPYGNTLSQSGSLADANAYRFSSKEVHVNSGMYYYGYRFYDAELQRWMNPDPVREKGARMLRKPGRARGLRGDNLYRFCFNAPSLHVDPLGLEGAGGGILSDAAIYCLCGVRPADAANAFNAGVQAANEGGYTGAEHEAMRHCVASGLLATTSGCRGSACVGDNREDFQTNFQGQPPRRGEMGKHNNQAGRACAGCIGPRNNRNPGRKPSLLGPDGPPPTTPAADIIECCAEELENGGLDLGTGPPSPRPQE